MAARYYLEANYPHRPDIWNTRKGSASERRELDEDINSRALHANVLGVNALIHLHTNAGGGSGAEAIYHMGRPEDRRMASSILCYMDELIRSTKYKDFRVKREPVSRSNLALNSLASMPSVVVEVGYHTNPSDAVALQDPDFMKTAMKGVAKGYRAFVKGEECIHFSVEKIDDIAASVASDFGRLVSFPVKVDYIGQPHGNIKAKIEFLECPAGWRCDGRTGLVRSGGVAEKAAQYGFECHMGGEIPMASFRIRTTLMDSDGVEAEPVEHRVACGDSSGNGVPDGMPGLILASAHWVGTSSRSIATR